MTVDQKRGKKSIIEHLFDIFYLAKPEKLRFKAVVGLTSVFDIDIPVENSQRHNALVAVRWQVKLIW
jgi:hypothetical protein